MRGYVRRLLVSVTSTTAAAAAASRASRTVASELWGQGVHCTPQVQDSYPLYPPSQRRGLCQNFKQTTLTIRLYKVRTNLYPHLRKLSDSPDPGDRVGGDLVGRS